MRGSFEWMELQSLIGDINESRSRLATARSNKDNRLVRVLEAEITAAEGRRDRLLAEITTHLADAGEPAPAAEVMARAEAAAAEGAPPPEAVQDTVSAEEAAADQSPAELPPLEPPAQARESGAALSVGAPSGGSARADRLAWDRLTPSDIARAQSELGARRVEMLSRHATELKALEVDQAELESLEQAIDAFVERFNPSAEAAVVKLGEERELRAHGRG